MVSGYYKKPLSSIVNPGSKTKATFEKNRRSLRAVGVVTYNLQINNYDSHMLAVMFSVPYNRIIYSNWYAVGIFPHGECNDNLYKAMYKGVPGSFARARADGPIASYQGNKVKVSATMSESGVAMVRVDLNDVH